MFFCSCFCTLPKSVVFIFLVFELVFTSDASPLKHCCRQSLCFTLPFYLEASFSRDTLHLTHLLYAYKLYYVGCLSNIGVLLVFSSVSIFFLMRRPTCNSVSKIVSLILVFATYGCFRRYEEIGGSIK